MFLQRFCSFLVAACLLFPHTSLAEESLCAVVKIEISQELTLERQAFEATMRITNTLDSFTLEDINITIYFQDENKNPVIASSDSGNQEAKFFIKLNQSQSIDALSQGVNGEITGGSIAPQATGVLQWLIIPSSKTGGETSSGKLYYVGATLDLNYGGKHEVFNVAPDSIVVKPQPSLVLDYFLADEVNGDNPFTQEIEPVEPYTLGVRISNTGSGTAKSVKLKSAQPTIIENKQGLAVDFKITGSYINDQPAAKTLLLDFGDIPAKSNSVGRWIMETSLTGRFTEFSATYSHADELGGELTSLIDSVNTHMLVHDVLLDLPGRDNIRDFLARHGSDELYLYESESNASSLIGCIDCLVVTPLTGSLSSAQVIGDLSRHTLTVDTKSAPLGYIKLSDPYMGNKPFSKVVRADGKVLRTENFWLSKTIKEDKINYDYFINIFDANPGTTYTLDFGGVPVANLPPVIQHITDKVTYETGQVGFLIVSSDPNKTVPTLKIHSKPAGAKFEQKAPGQAVFHWSPQVGQAGTYTITFEANDGVNKTTKDVTIKVNPENDRDGDGMDDAWEQENFGNLDRDGSGDFDGDGYSDLTEFLNKTDPKVPAVAPGKPELNSPIYGGEVDTLTPVLKVNNSVHGTGDTVTYEYEVYADESMTILIAQSDNVVEGVQTTEVTLDADMLVEGKSVEDNHDYFWRVRAVGNDGTSEWENGRFFVNTVNDAPTEPLISQPANGGVLDSNQPTLIVDNATDIDRDTIVYSFKVYAQSDTGLSAPLYGIDGLAEGTGGNTSWQIPEPLIENTYYQWQVTATDEHGVETKSAVATFFIDTVNDAPTEPVISLPQPGAEVASTSIDLEVFNATDPEGAPLNYIFQVDISNSFDSGNVIESGLVAELETATKWNISGLSDNTTYYWRVKSTDGDKESAWVQGNFFVNIENDAPSVPTVANPGQGASVLLLTPTLQVNPSVDLDGDMVSYRFEIYEDENLSQAISSALVTELEWQVDLTLSDNTNYYWRVQAQDEHGATSAWSSIHHFFTNEGGVNDAPTFGFVKPDTNVQLSSGAVAIQWTDNDPDSNATIELRYVDSNNFEQVIVSNIEEDPDGDADQYLWNVSGLAPGDYGLKAIIQDDENTQEVVACCLVTVLPQQGGVIVTPKTALITEETGVSVVEVDVVLDKAPSSDSSLAISVSVSDSTEGILLSSNSLFFTQENWDIPQTIKVKGANDCDVDGDQVFNLVLGQVQTDDIGYQGVDPQDVAITNTDNEFDGQTLFICDYELQSQQPVEGSNLIDFTYKAVLTNTGAARTFLTATPVIYGSSIELVGAGVLNYPAVEAGASVLSSNEFTVRYDPAKGFDSAKLEWSIDEGSAPTADLAVTLSETVKLDESGSVYVGEYVIEVTNKGPSLAQNVMVTASYPDDVTILDYTVDNGDCEAPVTSCTIAQVAVGGTTKIWFRLQTPDDKKRNIKVSVSSDLDDNNIEDNSATLKFGGALTWLLLALLVYLGLRRKVLM